MPGWQPAYCVACAAGDWHLQVWDPKKPAETQCRIPYQCRSWRHQGECRQWKAQQDFSRVSEAMQIHGPWVYIVLTFAQADWPDKWAQYRAGLNLWAKLRKRFTREWGKIKYIQTWERHKKGGAHVNIVLANERFHEACCNNWRAVRRDWLEPNAVACGFGFRTWLEPFYDDSDLAKYIAKLSQEVTGSGVKNQVPEDAPPHFRRIRASARTLPPVAKSEYTGRLVFAPIGMYLQGSAGQQSESTDVRSDNRPPPKTVGPCS